MLQNNFQFRGAVAVDVRNPEHITLLTNHLSISILNVVCVFILHAENYVSPFNQFIADDH